MEPLVSFLGTPLAYDVAGLSEKLGGGAARLEHEKNRAMEFWACVDLTPREKAAAHLLAVIANHRAISWWREPDTPDGTAPMPALESRQEERLRKDTIEAANAYAAFLPEQQAKALVALAPKPQQTAPATDTATPAPVAASEPLDGGKSLPVKRRTWRDIAWPYVVETFKAGQYSTAKEFYRALENKAGTSGSPFDHGIGANLHSLYVRELSTTVSLKTIQNAWQKIRATLTLP